MVTTPDDHLDENCTRTTIMIGVVLAITLLALAAPLTAIVGHPWVCFVLVISLLGDSLPLLGLHGYSTYSDQRSFIRVSYWEPMIVYHTHGKNTYFPPCLAFARLRDRSVCMAECINPPPAQLYPANHSVLPSLQCTPRRLQSSDPTSFGRTC